MIAHDSADGASKVRRGPILLLLLILAPAILLSKAALVYFADVSVCLSPFGITKYEDRVAAALARVRSPSFRQWASEYGGQGMAARIDRLQPHNCCHVQHLGWLPDYRITLWKVLKGGPTHIVHFRGLGIARGNDAPPMIGTDVCGNVYDY